MDPIDNLTKLMAALRRQQSSGPDRTKLSPKGRADSAATPRTPTKPSLEQLERRIAERLRGLHAEDRHRAARTFLETVLTWEFGEELIQDPRFAEMVQEVESQIRSDPQLSARLDKLLKQLTRN